MRRTLVLMSTTALVLLVAGGVALAASINCPNASGGYCYGTNAGDVLYGTSNVDRMYGYGRPHLIYGDGGGALCTGALKLAWAIGCAAAGSTG